MGTEFRSPLSDCKSTHAELLMRNTDFIEYFLGNTEIRAHRTHLTIPVFSKTFPRVKEVKRGHKPGKSQSEQDLLCHIQENSFIF
jgi:hypothetical protein